MKRIYIRPAAKVVCNDDLVLLAQSNQLEDAMDAFDEVAKEGVNSIGVMEDVAEFQGVKGNQMGWEELSETYDW